MPDENLWPDVLTKYFSRHRIGLTLKRFSEKSGSPPASNLDPPVFKSSARMELLSLSAM